MYKLRNLLFVLMLSGAFSTFSITKVACIGNSITVGSNLDNPSKQAFPAVLDSLLGDEFQVKNFGNSGKTMLVNGDQPYMKQSTYTEALAYKPDIVVIKLGTNDSKPQNWTYKNEFTRDAESMIESFESLDTNPLIFLCYPATAYSSNFNIRESVILNEIIPLITQIAEEKNLTVIDLHSATAGMSENFPDGIHPNAAGAAVIANEIYRIITKTLETENLSKAIYVDGNAVNEGNGTLDAPFNTIQKALSSSDSKDTIYVTEGIYYPDFLENKRESCFKINCQLTILGGYNTSFTQVTGKSIIDGDVDQNDLSENYTGNLYQLIKITSYVSFTLKNFILKGAYAENGVSGAALQCRGSKLFLENVDFINNYSSESGGALQANFLTINIQNCTFINNYALKNGGAISLSATTALDVRNCLFDSNTAQAGAALYAEKSTLSFFEGNSFINNKSFTYGTLSFLNDASAEKHSLLNNTFCNNILNSPSGFSGIVNKYGGAAIYAKMYDSNSKLNLAHNTIAGNQSLFGGTNTTIFLGSAINVYKGSLLLMNNIIAGNYSVSQVGDLRVDSETTVKRDSYNVFTSSSGTNISLSTTNIVGAGYSTGIIALKACLDGSVEDDIFTANCTDNGGYTPTVKIKTLDFAGRAINCLSSSNRLIESAFEMDVDGDGKISGYLKYDQRGVVRQNQACIGAYEYYAEESNADNILKETDILLFPVSKTVYEISNLKQNSRIKLYDSVGRCVYSIFSRDASAYIDMNGLPRGIYVFFINEKSCKIIY